MQDPAQPLRPGPAVISDGPTILDRVVNVASVRQRSPFRYPGGKTWFVPAASAWLASRPRRPALLVEPFTGGGTIGLTAAFEGLVDRVLLVELDPAVAAVWRVLVDGQGPGLADRIMAFECTLDNVIETLARTPATTLERAFATIVRNRTARGGIMAEGAGLIRVGEDGKEGRGIASRWYPGTLRDRILAIHDIRDRLSFIEGDGLGVIEAHLDEPDTVFFVDPPYTAGGKRAGSRLYTASHLDHARLFARCASAAGDFLMTYDDADEVGALVEAHGLASLPMAMRNSHHETMRELLIGRDLSWVAGTAPVASKPVVGPGRRMPATRAA
ncbi:MAG: DNA adenine methylase [Chloroflexi bacterium]|nr:DNA adenine methylase [Chloroflexota bacterium]